MWERTELLIQTSFCENIAQLNLLFVLMLAYVRYPSIYDVAIGDNDKYEKEEKAEKKTEVRLNDFVAHFQGKACSGLTFFFSCTV